MTRAAIMTNMRSKQQSVHTYMGVSQKAASMPGLPVSHLTPDHFKRWKEQRDLEKEQVGAAAQLL